MSAYSKTLTLKFQSNQVKMPLRCLLIIPLFNDMARSSFESLLEKNSEEEEIDLTRFDIGYFDLIYDTLIGIQRNIFKESAGAWQQIFDFADYLTVMCDYFGLDFSILNQVLSYSVMYKSYKDNLDKKIYTNIENITFENYDMYKKKFEIERNALMKIGGAETFQNFKIHIQQQTLQNTIAT